MHHHHYNNLLVLGVASFVGILGAWLFQKMKLPQVVGYISIGLLIGATGIGLVDRQHIESLEPFTYFSLGLIGFLVGGEIKFSEFKKYGKQFALILFGEGLLSFFLVGVSCGLFIFFYSGNPTTALAGGVIFGAIASATDPASTIDVLWENRSRGVLTSALIAVVALDDALAMSLYSVGKSVSILLTGGTTSIRHELLAIIFEIGGAVILGLSFAYVLDRMLRQIHDKEKQLALSICTLFLVIGLSFSLNWDVILSSMALGFGTVNLVPKRSEVLFKMIRGMSSPIYVLFFVLVGARLDISNIPYWIWILAVIYVVGRSIGKFVGTWMGAKASQADDMVRKYCGMGMFAQGGVAIGLSIIAGKNLNGLPLSDSMSLGEGVVSVITATTMIVQILGPSMTRLAIKLAGEIGRNITEEDIISNMSVSEVINKDRNSFFENDSIDTIVGEFSQFGGHVRIVNNLNGQLVGIITFDSLQAALPNRDFWGLLIASDIMEQPPEFITEEAPLSEAINLMHDTNHDEVMVKSSHESKRVIGILERSQITSIVRQRFLEKVNA